MAGANDLPQEIWELIVAYLPQHELRCLIGLNRKLYEIVLDERYRVVSWANPDSDLLKKLRRLSDPAIASHVRRLHIDAWSLRKLFGISATSMDGTGSSLDSAKRKGESKLRRSLPRFLSLPSSTVQHDSNGVPIPASPSIFSFISSLGISQKKKEMLALMTKAMSFMTNLKALIVEWSNLLLNLPLSTFLQNIPTSQICILTLNTSLNKLRPLLTLLQTPQLEELNLEFEWENASGGNSILEKENEAVLVDVLAPYIKSRASTLRSLRVISQASGDHSKFFSALSYLPHLNHLVLEIPFSKRRFTSTQALVDFLQSNAFSLTHLELIIQREWDRDRDRELEMQSNLVQFYHNFLRMDPWLSKLRSFGITAPPRSCKEPFSKFLLDRLPPTITTLRLAHRYYSLPELISMISHISSNLGTVMNLYVENARIPPPDNLKSMKKHDVWTLTFVIGENKGYINPLHWPHGHQMPLSKRRWNANDIAYLKELWEETNTSWLA